MNHAPMPYTQARTYARRYDDTQPPDPVIEIRLLDRHELFTLARWKSPRAAGQVLTNTDPVIADCTAAALGARTYTLAFAALTALRGVGWPVASAVLHFYKDDTLPILDFRAVWSLGWSHPATYSVAFWERYVRECRAGAVLSGLTVREFDKALWMWSKVHQQPASQNSRHSGSLAPQPLAVV